jgi:hypothetical protein
MTGNEEATSQREITKEKSYEVVFPGYPGTQGRSLGAQSY